MSWPELKACVLFWISPETVSGGYQSICLQSDIKGDGWWPANAKDSYFWEAIWFRLSQAQIWMSQSRSHQRAPFGFINSQRWSSLSIIAVIKMFGSCLAQTWNNFHWRHNFTSMAPSFTEIQIFFLFCGSENKIHSKQSSWDWNQFVEVAGGTFNENQEAGDQPPAQHCLNVYSTANRES